MHNDDCVTPTQESKKRELTSPFDDTDTKKSKTHIVLDNDDITAIANALKDTCRSEVLKSEPSSNVDDQVNATVEGVLAGLNKTIKKLEDDNADLRKHVNDLEDRIDKLEYDADSSLQYSKRNTLRISGIAGGQDDDTASQTSLNANEHRLNKKYEPTDLKIVEIANALGVHVSLEDIDRSHRIDPGKPNKPKDIIVKFKSRNALYRARVGLGKKGYPGFFINESLTQMRSSIFFQARKLVKERFLFGAWTYDGNIMVKDANRWIQRIDSVSGLMQVRSITPIPQDQFTRPGHAPQQNWSQDHNVD